MLSPVAERAILRTVRRRAPGREGGSGFAPSAADNPWQMAPWDDQSPVLLFTGSAGGGKSRLAAEMLHRYMLTYPGAMGLMLRKTRESMNNSTVLFYHRKIASRDQRCTFKPSQHRFEYANGSILAYGGMKDEEQREQVRSIGQDAGLDIVWMEEAVHFAFDDYQELIPRMRGKAAPYRQMILTTNPDAPAHWINERLIIGGAAKVYYSSATDNRFNPPDYVDKLKLMTGIQRQRLVDGKWAQAEGVIYDNFDVAKNVAEVSYNPATPILWAVDDGYAPGDGPGSASYHPRVVLIAQEDGRGGVNVLAERYRTGEASYDTTIDESLALCRDVTGSEQAPDVAYVDSSAAMLRGALTVRGIPNSGATHPVLEGIRNLRRMICDGQGELLVHIHPRCTALIKELQLYRYDDTAQVSGDRKPMKMDDHGPDCLRYLTYHLRFGV